MKKGNEWDYNDPMRFFADEMLGKLARWLRMSGFDVVYERQMDDETLLRQARDESRLILTRDTKLARKLKPEEYLFITHDYLYDQITEVYARFPELMHQQNPLSRCVECNTPIEPIEKEKVKDRVWPYVYRTQERFTFCPKCEKVYWEGTHVPKIDRRLRLFSSARVVK